MLTTNLRHLETAEEVEEILKNKENVVISCGRMGPMGIAVLARAGARDIRGDDEVPPAHCHKSSGDDYIAY